MAGIIPLPNTRVSNLLLRERLTNQFQSDQLDLFRLQEQISTGQRISLPSEDAPAALRAIALQRLIERKAQLESNINGGQIYLAATDTAISEVAIQLADLKGETLGVAGTLATQQDREAVIDKVNAFLDTLLGTANRQILGRHLFAGSQASQQPYSFEGNSVVYHGDDSSINNYSDIGVLFASNATGQDVFGGISQPVTGTVDLNPQLSLETQLSSLHAGRGISAGGALSISDGNQTSLIDISGARTIGDLVRMIEENPPQGRTVEVAVNGNGLTLSLDSGNIIIGEVGNGSTARELGILQLTTIGDTKVGTDLDPILLKTTQLDDLLGTKARAAIVSGINNDNSDILIEATNNGAAFDGVTVQFVDDDLLSAGPGLSAGNEVAVYEANAQAAQAAITFAGGNNDLTLTANTDGTSFNNVRVDVTATGPTGVTTASYDVGNKVLSIVLASDDTSAANQAIAAIAGIAGNPFTATLDASVDAGNDGTGTIAAAVAQTNLANTGNSGGDAKTLYVRIDPGNTNANQVVAAINTEATFSANLDPADTASLLLAGTGLVDLDQNGNPAVTAGGAGATLDQASGIRVVNGGQTYDIDFVGAETVEDLLNILNGSEAGLLAEINSNGAGINVRSRLSGQDFQIGEVGGFTATQLGIRTFTGDTRLNDLNYGNGVPTSDGFDLKTATGNDLTIHTRDGQDFLVDLSGATSLADVVDAINAVTGVSVAVSTVATGNVTVLRLVDGTAGADQFSVSQVPGSIAGRYLGLVAGNANQVVSGSDTLTGNDDKYTDFTITARDGQTFGVDLSAATTMGDALAAINAASAATTVDVTAQLAANGNGIELIDNTVGGGSLTVDAIEGSQTAELLGLIAEGQTQNVSTNGTITGTDQNFLETDSVFNTLIRLRDALTSGNQNAIERAIAKVDSDIGRVTFARAEVGARWQGLDQSEYTLLEEEIQLRSALSEEIDVDLIEAISQMTARQVSLEASLRSTANIMQLSLLNYI